MTLLDRLYDDTYWKETVERMLRKNNLTSEQRMEIILFDALNRKEEFISEILSGTYEWSIPRKAYLNKLGTKKKRVVYIYSIKDRYILGVLYRVFSAHFSHSVSSNCYSYKRGVKTVTAIDYLNSDTRLREKIGVKLDISAYFNSVSEEYLHDTLLEITTDNPELRKLLLDCYEDNRVVDGKTVINEYKSLTPGTAFSSFLANYCLKDVDDTIVNKLGLTYARYSDDIIIFGDSREQVQEALNVATQKLSKLNLSINEKKYEWFAPGDEIDFLGLKLLPNGSIDIGDNSARKFKKKIKHACIVGRTRIEMGEEDTIKVAKDIIGRYNYRVYKCYVYDASKFGWAYYAFRYITTPETIVAIDQYFKDRIRQMITGKNNSGNIKSVPDTMLEQLGYIPMGEMYKRFREDFDYYCDTADIILG